MLEEVLRSYRVEADKVNWQSYNKNDLFFEYIKHEHDELRGSFYSAIICRFWGYCSRVYKQCNQRIPFEQCYDILIDTVNYVLKNRVWEKETNSLYNDPTGPDKAFHIALKRYRSIVTANITAKKRGGGVTGVSIEAATELYGDTTEGVLGIADASFDNSVSNFHIKDLIKSLDPLSVILIDQVCFGEYWQGLKTVAKNVKKLELENFDYYRKNYGLSREDYVQALYNVKSYKPEWLTICLKRALNKIKGDIV